MKNKIFLFIIFFSVLFLFLTPKTNAMQNASAGASGQLQARTLAKTEDVRTKILKAYLEKYSSPLAQYADDFISSADAFNLDWKLVAAISGVESTFGKQIPYNSYNGWGWGIYGNNVIRFSSWKEGIETVSKGLRENYVDKLGDGDVYRIGRLYAASPSWASRVEYFMNDINKFAAENLKSFPISL